ncbi:unnamed protein product [Staurois parvus]|uniref:Uncharacterized protein n=1 Tax=Staurois parvus TaxID=386267 RepID=A0ABN9C596_9NEOB|nr:unnamed protein product [Staurois parvus]
MRGPGRPDIVNAGSGESGYSECRVRGDGYTDIVNAGSGESGYSECGVLGERI